MLNNLLLFLALAASPEISSGQIDSPAHKMVEIHIDAKPPEGFDLFSSEWLILQEAADWRQYENGSIFVMTGPPGTYQARWRGQYIDWTNKQGRSEWRVYTITIGGSTTPPTIPPVDPTVPPTVPPTIPPIPPIEPGKRLVVVVYESSEQPIPLHVHKARTELEKAGHQVRLVDRDTVTGLGGIPAEITASLKAAKDSGAYPALVVSAGGRVAYTVPLPTTADLVIREATR